MKIKIKIKRDPGMWLTSMVPAFTLVECMVALLISGLLSFTAIRIMEILGKVYRDYDRSTESALQVTGFQSAMLQDFTWALEIETIPRKVICRYAGHTVTYHFNEDSTLRTYQSGDIRNTRTFHLKVSETTCYLNGEKRTGGMIDRLVCHLQDQATPATFSFFKQYSAHAHIMNHARTN